MCKAVEHERKKKRPANPNDLFGGDRSVSVKFFLCYSDVASVIGFFSSAGWRYLFVTLGFVIFT